MASLLFVLLLQARWLVPPAGTIALAGAWRFHAGDAPVFASPAYDDGQWQAATLPALWSGRGPGRPAGVFWYRGRFLLDATPEVQLGLALRAVGVAFQVYLDGVPLGGLGAFPPDVHLRSSIPVTYDIPISSLTPGPHLVAIRVFAPPDAPVGFEEIAIGPVGQLLSRVLRDDLFMLGAAVLFLGLAVYQLLFWTRRREAREHLFVFLFCTGLALSFVLWMPSVRLALSPALDWVRLYLALSAASGAALCMGVRGIFELEPESLAARAARGLGVYFGLLVPLALVLPQWGEVNWLERFPYDAAVAAGSLFLVALAVRERARGLRHAEALFWGSVVLAVAALHDVSLSWGALPAWGGSSIVMQYGAVGFVLSVALTTAGRFADSQTTALYDRLTGLYRREVVMDALAREIRRAARAHQPISVVMMDIDHFKAVNDSLGHQAGDRVLAEVGRRLAEAGRVVDWLGRYGGEEFIALLGGTGGPGGLQAAERFRTAVSALPVSVGRVSRGITLSAGVARYDGGEEWPTSEQLVGAADAALYRAKSGGRNRTSE
jgi:diguanylate cyclase (GGDEF)-like protein